MLTKIYVCYGSGTPLQDDPKLQKIINGAASLGYQLHEVKVTDVRGKPHYTLIFKK